MRCKFTRYAFYLAIAGLILTPQAFADDARQPIRVVIAAMYELGEARGDAPGELQFWVERLPLERSVPFPMGESALYLNDEGVMAVLLGGGIPNATATIMALGADPRFDLSNAYWLIAGVAGGDPTDMSLGSAAWARHVVDGDLAYEIDAREIPEDWPYGFFPLGSNRPATSIEGISTGWTLDTISFSLNTQLVDWAYSITRDLVLEDAHRVLLNIANCLTATRWHKRHHFVTVGDTLSSSTYWHGRILNQWANDWLRLYAGERRELHDLQYGRQRHNDGIKQAGAHRDR